MATAPTPPAAPATTLDDILKEMVGQGAAFTKVFDKIADTLTDILKAVSAAASPGTATPPATPPPAGGPPAAPPPKPPRRQPTTGTSNVGYRNRQKKARSRPPLSPKSGGSAGGFDAFTTGAAKVGAVLFAANQAMEAFGNTIAGFVGKARPDAIIRWTVVTDDLSAVIGRILLPVMERLTVLMRTLGDAIQSLSPAAKTLIAGFAGGAGLGAVLTAVGIAAKVLLASFGPIPLIVGALASAFLGVAGTMSSGAELAAAFGSVLTVLGSVIETLAKVIVPTVATVLVPVLEVLSAVLGRVAAVFSEVAGIVGGVLQAAVSAVMALFRVIADVLGAVLTPVLQLLTPLIELVGDALQGLADTIKWFLEMLGVSAEEYEVKPGSSVGAAVRKAQFGGMQDFANRAYASAYAGGAVDVSREQLNELKEINRNTRAAKEKTTTDKVIGYAKDPFSAVEDAGMWAIDRMAQLFG